MAELQWLEPINWNFFFCAGKFQLVWCLHQKMTNFGHYGQVMDLVDESRVW